MRTILMILLLTFPLNSFSQENKFVYGSEKYMTYHYNCSIDYGYTFKKSLPDGEYFAYSAKNPELILVAAKYENRRKSGIWRIYNPNNKRQEFQQYEKGKLLSEKYLDSLERTIFEVKYEGKQEFGHYYSFDPDGSLKNTEEFWRHKRKSTQIITKYYPNGQIESVIQYKNIRSNSIPIGKWTAFYENGQPKSVEIYGKNWKRIGEWRKWDEHGVIVSETNYSAK
jgi:antitoxin component YwqK of YwqJK toxin-antitoxin module